LTASASAGGQFRRAQSLIRPEVYLKTLIELVPWPDFRSEWPGFAAGRATVRVWFLKTQAPIPVLSPIPCWAHLPTDRYRERIKSLVEQVDAEAARARRQSGASVLGVKAILTQNPLTRPDSVARSPAPLVHAATKAARKMFCGIYTEFVSAFRAAAEALRHGLRDVFFPAGSFPPALPFVPS
jgi:hypothetical protein